MVLRESCTSLLALRRLLSERLIGASQLQCRRSIIQSISSNRAFTSSSVQHATSDSAPRIVQPSIWQSIIPRALRESRPRKKGATSRLERWRTKEWNPATVYIIFSLLIGSQAINTIALKHETANFSRKADAKIALLREVIERVQKGERVDVEGLLGTGDKEKEEEWEQVLKEIEEEDLHWQPKRRGRAKDLAAENDKPVAEAANTTGSGLDAASQNLDNDRSRIAAVTTNNVRRANDGPRGFY